MGLIYQEAREGEEKGEDLETGNVDPGMESEERNDDRHGLTS